MGRLFQQYVADMYTKIEDGRLKFIQRNQSKLRAELYQGLADAVQSLTIQLMDHILGKRSFSHPVLLEVLDTNINCTKMQWQLCITLASQISLSHSLEIYTGKKSLMNHFSIKLLQIIKI